MCIYIILELDIDLYDVVMISLYHGVCTSIHYASIRYRMDVRDIVF